MVRIIFANEPRGMLAEKIGEDKRAFQRGVMRLISTKFYECAKKSGK
jgi:hypothetical protein